MESYKLLMIYETSCPRSDDRHLYFHYLNVMLDNLFVYIIWWQYFKSRYYE